MKKYRKYTNKVLMPVAFFIKEKRIGKDIQIEKKYNMFLKGFLSESKLMYNLNRTNYHNFVSDYHEMKTGDINGGSANILNNKVKFGQVLQGIAEVPDTLAVISKGGFISYSPSLGCMDDILPYLEKVDSHKLVLKPIGTAEGRGVSLISLEAEGLFRNGQRVEYDDLVAFILSVDNYFISEYIEQSDFSNSLFPHTLNTIRILTMVDPGNNEVFIASAAQRIGTFESAPTDNYSRRGLSSEVNLESGILSPAVQLQKSGQIIWHHLHPDTKAEISGKRVPHWPQMKEYFLKAANFLYQTYQISYIGWDAVITNDGFKVLEGNSWPGVGVNQVHHPLLTNKKIKAFYQFHHIL